MGDVNTRVHKSTATALGRGRVPHPTLGRLYRGKARYSLHDMLIFLNITLYNLNQGNYIYIYIAASWRKRLGARLPPLGSRVRVSVSPCGFRGGRIGVWVGFSRGFSRFPLPQISFHHLSTLISSISFHFISSALVMVRQVWSAGTLATHGPIISGLHRISSLDLTLCWTRVEDIYFI